MLKKDENKKKTNIFSWKNCQKFEDTV
jgi:hypothetical protein